MALRNELTYASVTQVLRPPRVAVLFRADESWRSWARLALRMVSELWGGLGFVLVPYDENGKVNPAILRVLKRYDPDHVVVMSIHVSDWERIAPGFLPVGDQAGAVVAGNERAQLIDQLVAFGDCYIDPAGESARQLVAKRCTLLHSSFDLENLSDQEVVQHVRLGDSSTSLVSWVDLGHFQPDPCLAASQSWESDASLVAGMRLGVVDQIGEWGSEARPEPDANEILAWLLHPGAHQAPDDLVWYPGARIGLDPSQQTSWLRAFDRTVGTVYTAFYTPDSGAIVVGDTADDFALAMLYDRVLGVGLWLTTTMLDDDRLRDAVIRPSLESAMRWRVVYPQKTRFLSASLPDDLVASMYALLCDGAPYSAVLPQDGQSIRSARQESIKLGAPSLKEALQSVAILEPLGVSTALPSVVDENDTTVLSVPPSALRPAVMLGLKKDMEQPYWLVDATISPGAMPRGRGLRPKWLQVAESTFGSPVQLRASRDGFTYHSRAQHLIVSGSNMESRLARPRIRQLGMLDWVTAMAEDSGIVARLSTPGTQSQLVARRLGGRHKLIELVTGPHLNLLRRFSAVAPGTTTTKEFPNDDGCVIRGDVFPAFDAMVALSDGDDASVAQLIDQLSVARLLRRGAVLRCVECQRYSFVGIDELGQTFDCRLCAAQNELTSQRWRSSDAQPTWFYDLHTSFRELIRTGGDVVLLAANHLKQGRTPGRAYCDVAEVEFLENGKRIAEVDLIALVGDEVVAVEAKKGRAFGKTVNREREIQKKLRIAQLLQVDAFVLATTELTWNTEDLSALANRLSDWDPALRPTARILTALTKVGGNLADIPVTSS